MLEDRIGGLQNIEAVGRTDAVSGGFTVAGTTVADIRAEVQVATITSDSTFRDGRFAGSIMDTAAFPTATFTAPQATLPSLPADGETVTVPVSGELTLKGVTRPVGVTALGELGAICSMGLRAGTVAAPGTREAGTKADCDPG